MEFKLAQGCTSLVIGNCGFSAAPFTSGNAPGGAGIFAGMQPDWEDMSGFFTSCERAGVAANAVALVGHNTIRSEVMGNENRAPTAGELEQMRGHAERGAFSDSAVSSW